MFSVLVDLEIMLTLIIPFTVESRYLESGDNSN